MAGYSKTVAGVFKEIGILTTSRKGVTMTTRTVFGSIVLMFILALPARASGQEPLHKYFSDMAKKVKATNDPVEKRRILSESFQTMSTALDMAQSLPLVSNSDRVAMNSLKAALQDKQDELAGNNGYERITDAQLNAFSDYVVQNMEQAYQMITISLVALLLIVLLVVLLL